MCKMEYQKAVSVLTYIAFIGSLCLHFVSGIEEYYYLLQTFEDVVGGGNSSYFKLTKNGDVHIFLQTLDGDADLYVSESNPKPTFEDYDLKSVTCGEDHLDIPKSFKRPTSVAIYGHPRFAESHFRCSVYLDTRDVSSGDQDWLYQNNAEQAAEEEHPGWMFLLKILEFVLDVVL